MRTNSKGQNVNFRISYKKRGRAPAHAWVAAVSDSFKPSGRRDAQEGTEEQNKSALNVSSPGNDCHAGELARRKLLVKPLRHRFGFFFTFYWVGVDGSKFTTFHVVSRILCDDEPANLTHASTRSLHTPVRFEKIGELGRFAADLLQYWVSIKRGFLFGTTTILKCTGVQNDCTHLTKNRNRRSGCRYHNWPFFKSKVYYIKIQVGNIAFVNGNN